ncbi:MAG: hypothetical protein DCC55_05000 [Chloroflexi bacterium]|nr:MAG: hypothetical protein DCC55_05000 [Chloroflexota bacterium]
MNGNIVLTDPTATPARILQLYEHLELYSAGDPPANTLFVLGRPPLAVLATGSGDQLLLIDPPADARQRFRLPEQTAALFTGPPQETGLPQVQTTAGGVAHIRIGEHLLDIYSQRSGNIVHLPALGILCGGQFGSDATLPQLAPASDGSEELDTLRLLARLVKERQIQLYIPQTGLQAGERAEVMRRLANDVAYLHSLRRVVPALAQRGDEAETSASVADSLLPADRNSLHCRRIHLANVQTLLGQTGQKRATT